MSTQVQRATPIHNTLDGRSLEETSDHIDNLNRIKAEMREAPIFEDEKEKQKRFRQYHAAKAHVIEFYKEQHKKQTYEFNIEIREKFFKSRRPVEMSVWEAMVKLNAYVDESDPDTEVTQIEHLLQTAEAMRRDGKPRWMILTGLIHDLGKLLSAFGAEGQWEVVGDTFPVGCAYHEKIILHDNFKNNPDYNHPVYSTKYGVYSPGIGLDNLKMSWGHDEYLYHVVEGQSTLPKDALAMIRYHSFYSWHSEGAYTEFMNESDHRKLAAVNAFNPYDLYSKSDEPPNVEELKPFYLELIDEFFPQRIIKW
ncbi:inositol oxygenase [Sclerotinia borealis F-4128]|uniref:Inositol oxygenase n=1 Tax=Sclerotinia borealis (strain F-4128) TaxID=1432307 RepID=W9CQM3_SCLBF|nr:inositol oxygenase [Sclerotinia borealis F-4128]